MFGNKEKTTKLMAGNAIFDIKFKIFTWRRPQLPRLVEGGS
jgi:hypothetical protein